MAQITFKIPESDIEFLHWISNKTAMPTSSIYRNATLEYFHQWKINYLMKEYQKGAMGFKRLCNLANITFNEGMLLLQENNIEPPIPEIVDDYTNEVRKTLTIKDLFKKGKIPVRKSPEIIPQDDKNKSI